MAQQNRYPEAIVAGTATKAVIEAATTYPLAKGEIGYATDTDQLYVGKDPATGGSFSKVPALSQSNTWTGTNNINTNSTAAFLVEQDGVKDNVLVVDTTNGRVGIGTIPYSALDVSGNGQIRIADVRTSNSNRVGQIMGLNYTSGAWTAFALNTTSANNIVYYGGGLGGNKAATKLDFYTAPDVSTDIGTLRMNVGSGGGLSIIGGTDTQQLTVKANSTQTANIVEFRNSSGTVLSGADKYGQLFSTGPLSNTNLLFGNGVTGAGNLTHTTGQEGYYNIAIGANSMYSATTANKNVSIGYGSAYSITSGYSNLFLGTDSGYSLTTGTSNIGIGYGSLKNSATGTNFALAIGVSALDTCGTGNNYSIGIGYLSGNKNPGAHNIYIGALAGLGSVSTTSNASYNLGIGYQTLTAITTAASNMVIGYQSGLALTTGSSNIFIGKQSGSRQTTASNKLIIDNQQRADADTELTNSIIVGTMAAAPTNQTLTINAGLTANGYGAIVGNADVLQLKVKANATQTANLTEWQNSSGTVWNSIGLTGSVFNESGDASTDFRVESDTEANMLFVDANADTDGAIYLGGNTNGIKINKGGEITLIGTATRWNDLRVEPVARTTGTKAPSFVAYKTNVAIYDFDNAIVTNEKEIFFTVQMPHDWKEGSTIYPHVHWVNRTSGSAGDVVKWVLDWTKATISGTFGATTPNSGTTIVASGDITSADEHLITSLGTIDMTGDKISTILICRLYRNSSHADDTYAGTAGLLYLDFHYEIDTIGGSKDEFSK